MDMSDVISFMYGDKPHDEFHIPVFSFEVALLGYVRLILIVLTTLANVVVVAYFLHRRNRGKATSLLFISIAVSDTLTGLILLPNSVYAHILVNEYLSYSWCYAYMYAKLYFAPVFHTISIWQTVLLCVQRYMCVCHPFLSGRWCSFWKTFLVVSLIYVMAFLLHINQLLEEYIEAHECKWITEKPCTTTCLYIWFCVVFIHFIPCVTLFYLTVKTLLGLRRAGRRVSRMIHVPVTSGQRSTRDRIITITATLVVIVFLIPEIPFCVYRFVFIINKHMETGLEPVTNHLFHSVYEVSLIVSFHCNFWIYCIMMREFRQLILRLLGCSTIKNGFSRIRSFSRASRSSGCGSAMTSISRTSSVVSRNRVLSSRTMNYSTQSETAHDSVPVSPTSPNACRYADISSGDHTEDLIDDVFI